MLRPGGGGARWDWVLARVIADEEGVYLHDARALRACVGDRHARTRMVAWVGGRACAVLPLPGCQLRGGATAGFELDGCPGCDNRPDVLLLMLGLLSARVAELAGVPSMPAKGGTYVHDVRLAAAEAFADLRETIDGG